MLCLLPLLPPHPFIPSPHLLPPRHHHAKVELTASSWLINEEDDDEDEEKENKDEIEDKDEDKVDVLEETENTVEEVCVYHEQATGITSYTKNTQPVFTHCTNLQPSTVSLSTRPSN